MAPQNAVVGIAPFAHNRRQTTPNWRSGVDHHTVDNSGDDRHNPLLKILFFGKSAPKAGACRLGKSVTRGGAAMAWRMRGDEP
jgi:hypothetical protein